MNMATKLYDFQERDIQYTINQLFEREKDRMYCPYRYIVNFSEPGVGKTLETVETLKRLEISDHDVLVICPKALIHQWQYYLPNALISSYEMYRSRGEIKFYKAVILDEFHKVKSRDSQIARKIRKLRTSFPNTLFIGLTGTPIRNKTPDMWSLLYTIGAFGEHPYYNGWTHTRNSYWAYCDRYCIGKDNGFTTVYDSYNPNTFGELTEMLQSRVAPIRRELNIARTKNIELVKLEMEPAQKKLYNDIKKLIYEELPPNLSIPNTLTKLIRLQQVTSAPSLWNPHIPNGAKLNWLMKRDPNPEEGEPIVVFSRFSSALREAQKRLPTSLLYTGDMSAPYRKQVLEKFATGNYKYLLATIGAAGTGLDGLQHITRTAVFLDRDWSPAVNQQAEARLYRTGQEHDVTIYILQCEHTIDQYVELMLDNKENNFSQLLKLILDKADDM